MEPRDEAAAMRPTGPPATREALLDHALKAERYATIRHFWEDGPDFDDRHLNVDGPGDSQKAYLIAALERHAGTASNIPVVLVPDELVARTWQRHLRAYTGGTVRIFHGRDYALTPVEAMSREPESERMGVLRAWMRGELDALIVPGAALQHVLMPPAIFREATRTFHVGDIVEPEELLRDLESLGYERRELAEAPSEYARRGDIVDVVPGGQEVSRIGFRISFFDNEIDQLKSYDIRDQRTLEAVTELTIYPTREVVPDAATVEGLRQRMRTYADEAMAELKRESRNEAAAALGEAVDQDLEALDERRDNGVFDRWLPFVYPDSAGILDWAEALGGRLVVDETKRLRERMDAHQADQLNHMTTLMERGKFHASTDRMVLGGAELMKRMDRRGHVLTLARIGAGGNGFPGGETVRLGGRDADGFRGHESRLWQLIRDRHEVHAATYLAAPTAEQRLRLKEEMAAEGIEGQATILPLNIAEGFEWPKAALYLLGTREIFGREKRRRRRRETERDDAKPIAFFSDLEPGDLVVHEVHGIGRFDGLTPIRRDGVRRDYLKISYRGDDSLYIPVEGLDQIQKYIGTDGRAPRLSKLGGSEWRRLKERARDSIRELAVNLVDLYAKRRALTGYVYDEDNVWEKEFADSFPYEETEDQLRCIREVKDDMASPEVMDRLLCGDVGYGKTEVAFRAMFKAVVNGRQAALLAPTTVLARQHYENFMERIGDFPVRVGHLSRFAGAEMERRTVRGLRDGSVDVVIGTHRILSKDITFKRLGLLVIDEEQRFGVDHKEKLKERYPRVDVLSLTATPIPRTLHMSLSGIRDISIIEEPPEDRRPVQTYVMPYDDGIVADAILREVGRGGQVFYLFNDTYHIVSEARRLEEMLPGIRVLHAHGRMSEHTLEDVIQRFIDGEADVLVCTTIIESGVDMPNVNTMIVTQADRLGLAQMYQLRGRVGRSSRQAYAYITYEPGKILREDSEKRLSAIRDYTELGSGFKIAMRDLEVRGAGNLLGGEQHGHMEAIGYELYMRMLDEEIRELKETSRDAKGEGDAEDEAPGTVRRATRPTPDAGRPGSDTDAPGPLPASVETVIDFQVDAILPESYITDGGQRMAMYRKIVGLRHFRDYLDILDEMEDRFGPVPAPAVRLADIAYVRVMARRAGFTRVSLTRRGLLLECHPAYLHMEALSELLALPEYAGRLLFNAGEKPYVLLREAGSGPRQALDEASELFRTWEEAGETENETSGDAPEAS